MITVEKDPKQDTLNAAKTPYKLIKVDLKKPQDIVSVIAFDVGFAAKNKLGEVAKPSQLAPLIFKKECISFLKVCSPKVLQRLPLKYRLMTGASYLDPTCASQWKFGQNDLQLGSQ